MTDNDVRLAELWYRVAEYLEEPELSPETNPGAAGFIESDLRPEQRWEMGTLLHPWLRCGAYFIRSADGERFSQGEEEQRKAASVVGGNSNPRNTDT